MGNAVRLIKRHGAALRYCYRWKAWLAWDGVRWVVDEGAEIGSRAKDTIRQIYGEAARETDDGRRRELVEHGRNSEQAPRIEAMIKLARCEPGVPVTIDTLNADPWLINVLNGTLDLRTGRLRPHDPADMMTTLCRVEYDESASCPHWRAMFERIFGGDATLIAYLRRLLGYCLTGVCREQILPIFHGCGANGKSTILTAMMEMLGTDYAWAAPQDLLMWAYHEPHPTIRASLYGKRLVTVIETDEGRRLNEGIIKQLTGGDPVSARYCYGNFFEFLPTHKMILATNHQPDVRGTDHAIWRRLKLVPFEVAIPESEQDKTLPEKLRNEYGGILAWCVAGCTDWLSRGMRTPPKVELATAGYREEQDIIGNYIAERCVALPGTRCETGHLYRDYTEWCRASGIDPWTKTKVTRRLAERGFRTDDGKRYYVGIGILAQPMEGATDGAELPF